MKNLNFEANGEQLVDFLKEKGWFTPAVWKVFGVIRHINLSRPLEELSKKDFENLFESLSKKNFQSLCGPLGKPLKCKLPLFVENVYISISLKPKDWRQRKTKNEAIQERYGFLYYIGHMGLPKSIPLKVEGG